MITKLLKRKLNEYMLNRLGMYVYRKGWLKGDCPSCGDHKFGVHLGMNRTNCFKCGYHPSPIDLVMELEGLVTYPETKVFLNAFEGLDYIEEVVKPLERKKDVVLPEGYKNIKRGDSLLARTVRKYIKRRGFDVDKLSRSGWGYCNKGKYFGYLIMPFFIQGKLVYFNARKVVGDGPKFNNPNIEDFGIGKNMLIYNMDALYMSKTIYAVESVTNAETIGSNAIGFGGKKVSNYQINAIIKSPCEKVIIGLDDDGIDDAIKLALKLYDHKKVKILQFPKDKDINDLGRKKTLKISHTSKYLTYNKLILMKNAI